MAFNISLYRFQTLISLFFLASYLFKRTNGAPVLGNVCRHSKNQALCLAYLRPESGSSTASLPQLAQITIDKAQFDAIGFKTKIHALLLKNLNNPRLSKLYRACEGLYDDALDALTIAPEHILKGRYGKLCESGAIVSNSVARAANLFKGQPLFADGNRELGILGDVIVVIAKSLTRRV